MATEIQEKKPKKFIKFLNLIKDQLFYIDDNIVVFTSQELKKAGFSTDDIHFILNALKKYELYSSLRERYGLSFIPIPKKHHTKKRLLKSVNWAMAFPEKMIEYQYFIELVSRDSFYDFYGSPKEDSVSGKKDAKSVKSGFKTASIFIESRSRDEDQHILLGDRSGKNVKAHMIVDGKTGEQRVEDGRGEPTDTAPHIETTITFSDGKKVKTTREKMEEVPNSVLVRPRLDISDFVISGGPDGQEMNFKVINIGNDNAMDIKFRFVADDFEHLSQNLSHLLVHGDTTKHYTKVVYGSTDMANKQLPNPKILLTYKNASNMNFQSGRFLMQELRADGRFNLSLGGYLE